MGDCCASCFDCSDGTWELSCKHNEDCALHNVDLDYACCYLGACDAIDYRDDKWQPVNAAWWMNLHDQCSIDCGPAPLCDTRADGLNMEAQCFIVNVLKLILKL